jgi:hypothetical protein
MIIYSWRLVAKITFELGSLWRNAGPILEIIWLVYGES